MEPIKYGKRQCDSQNNGPRGSTVYAQLNGRRLEFLHLKRVHNPKSEIIDQ